MTGMRVEDIELRESCGACPEDYLAYYQGKEIGYLRLRHGYFFVEAPYNGEKIYEAHPEGDGIFMPHERPGYLLKAKEALARHCNAQLEPDEDQADDDFGSEF